MNAWKSIRASARSRPGEDIGGQVGHPQLGLPYGGPLGLAPVLVQPDHPLGRLAQPGPIEHGDLRRKLVIDRARTTPPNPGVMEIADFWW
jgi:hypothetical protein